MTHTTITSTGAEEAEAFGWSLFFAAILGGFVLGMLCTAGLAALIAWVWLS